MKLLQKILYNFLFLFCVSSITAQDDFDVKLSETEVDGTTLNVVELVTFGKKVRKCFQRIFLI